MERLLRIVAADRRARRRRRMLPVCQAGVCPVCERQLIITQGRDGPAWLCSCQVAGRERA